MDVQLCPLVLFTPGGHETVLQCILPITYLKKRIISIKTLHKKFSIFHYFRHRKIQTLAILPHTFKHCKFKLSLPHTHGLISIWGNCTELFNLSDILLDSQFIFDCTWGRFLPLFHNFLVLKFFLFSPNYVKRCSKASYSSRNVKT